MAFKSMYFNIVQILLLFLTIRVLSAPTEHAGTSQSAKDRNNEPHRSISISNPFLNKETLDVDYHGDPFLTVNSSSVSQLFDNESQRISKTIITPFLSGQKKINIGIYIRNPFSMSTNVFHKNDSSVVLNVSRSANENNTLAFPYTRSPTDTNDIIILTNITHVENRANSSSLTPTSDSRNTSENPVSFDADDDGKQLTSATDPPISFKFPSYESSRTKSELKCEEYNRQFLNTAEVLSLVGTNVQVVRVENEQCTKPDRLVIGGVTAMTGEFPHMVALGKFSTDGSFVFYCGGTIISPNWVLTAAHCTHGPIGGPTVAKIGLNDLRDELGTISTIERTVRHPSYRAPAMYADIALLKLQSTITFNTLIKPACLYQLYDTVPKKAWISGWGVTEFGGERSNKLQKAQLETIDNIMCSLRHNRSISVPHGVTPSMICAGDPRGDWKKDTCQGDSGGPLQVPHPMYSCLFQIIGITSFGQGCAVKDSPGVYTRVSHYLNWIEDIVWPELQHQ